MGWVSELESIATMPHEATLIYNTTLLRQAVFGFWRRSVGVGFFVALLIAALGLVVLVALGQASGSSVALQPCWRWALRSP
jgi:hypothetical protein